jgi:hypothetical protein
MAIWDVEEHMEPEHRNASARLVLVVHDLAEVVDSCMDSGVLARRKDDVILPGDVALRAGVGLEDRTRRLVSDVYLRN